jgi:uncharacterized protein
MRVRFNEISLYGNSYAIEEIEELSLHHDFIVKGPLDARCTLNRKDERKVALQGRLKAVVTLTCDSCLAPYDIDVDTEMQVLFEVESSDSWHLKELEYNIPDLDSVVLDEPVIDLDDVIRQQLYLALPMKNLCSEQCKGMCSQCGANLNLSSCGCAKEIKGSPFAILARKKKS